MTRPPPSARSVTVSENWGFAAFETERYKLVVDEDAVEPCQLFDLAEDAAEDHDLLLIRRRPGRARRSWRRMSVPSSARRRPVPFRASSRVATTEW